MSRAQAIITRVVITMPPTRPMLNCIVFGLAYMPNGMEQSRDEKRSHECVYQSWG
jgi:hypothetical protein